ncbi:SprT family zinc-dependent metalloprotease [Psychromonas antarctica]|uniref:SprT family zinc-dependent metalloprotease n=1 Tax=Psychromonas antarctica TaxID=67573 RepID=UPI001EE8CD2B|nr:SprT family zinc-dependent metalloprotease [Psychromonas antarctica]MCG6200183.1 SprT family zinc-dependent metalloprotease [Psychromonas antarctica]
MPTDEDKKVLRAKGEDCFILAECFFDRPFKRPDYLFNQRGRSAATAHLQRNIIKFNATLFKQNRSEFINQVVAHEVAHLIAFQHYGKVRPHGREWQSIMRHVFDCPANTTHSLDISDVRGQLFNYQCLCSAHQLTIRRHNKILRGEKYLCKKCKGVLQASSQHADANKS